MRIRVITSILLFLVGFLQVRGQDILKEEKLSEAEVVRQAGHRFFDVKKYDSALVKYKDALLKFEKLEDSTGIAKCYNNIGNSNMLLGNNKEAVSAFYAAININQLLKKDRVLIGNYINLAAYYKLQGEYGLALEYYLAAKDKVAIARDDAKLSLIYVGLASILSTPEYDGNDYVLANSYFHKALEKYTLALDSSRMSSVYNNLGVLLFHQLKYDSSLYYYSKSIAIKDVLGDQRGQIIAFLNMGKIYMEQGNYGMALDYYNKGAELALELNDEINYRHLVTNILKCKIKLGELDDADSLFAIYNTLNDSIYDTEKAKTLKELEVLYETQKIGSDLKDQIKQTEAKTRLSYWYLTLAIGIALLFIITVLFFMQRQRFQQRIKAQELDRLKHEQEIVELNALMQGQDEERNRIAEDLHDRLGARLAAIKLLSEDMENPNPKLTEMLEASIKETREISHNLSTDMLTRFGLENAINDQVQDINQSNMIEGTFIATNMNKRFKKTIEKAIYFVILELLNNMIKHASASTFHIQLTYFEQVIDLLYEDDGLGFDTKEAKLTGMGMKNLKARIESVKGTLNIDSLPKKGVQVVITVPVPIEMVTIV